LLQEYREIPVRLVFLVESTRGTVAVGQHIQELFGTLYIWKWKKNPYAICGLCVSCRTMDYVQENSINPLAPNKR